MMEVVKKPQPKTFDFNQRFWFREEKGNKKNKNCGCIAATLLHFPYFKKLGLKFTENYSPWHDNKAGGMGAGEHRELGIVYKKQFGIGALTKLFEINPKESAYIFGSKGLRKW